MDYIQNVQCCGPHDWFIVDRDRWRGMQITGKGSWQKTISNGSHYLIKDDDVVLTKYSTANWGRNFAANQGIEGLIYHANYFE